MEKRASKFRSLLANRKGMHPVMFWGIGILVAIALIVFIVGQVSEPEPLAITPGAQPITGVDCDTQTTPDIDIDAYDVENPTTAVTDAKNLYRKKATSVSDAGTWTTWTLGTSIDDLELFTEYEFLIPGDLTTSNVKDKAFGEYLTYNTQCIAEGTKKIDVCNDETYDGLTATFVNADGDVTTEEEFSAGDVQTISLRWKAGSDQCYGHPYLESYPMLSDKTDGHSRKYPNCLCLKLNTTSWEKPKEVYLADGTEMDRISAPTISNADGATTHTMYCYEAPVITDRQLDIYATLEADGTAGNQPGRNETAYLYAGNSFIDSDTGEPDWGCEDDSAAYTAGNGDADELTMIFNVA